MIRWVCLAMVLALSACAARPEPTLHHVVFFELADPADAAALTADCKQLEQIPGVTESAAGVPVSIGRESVDARYSVGLYVGFRSIEDYRRYVDHPVHVVLVSKWKPRWKTILVRDFGSP